eukprot:gnl/TRDRNA2_/TRDRNA2_221066_c0_seq1.p1 gnl/TRDRNA2_/TRDRNA2_221066_c0~~gnl/TRDRNA2_/TRDRNA2_221066_c0_seq1.p1  ORF type:complete len:136 (-),score=11.78 gnl/TRDRNA2_/TRDRNA2_221066_c0_seq1:42-422(-)
MVDEGMWFHRYFGHVPEWSLVDLYLRGGIPECCVPERPNWILPDGWLLLPGVGYVDEVTWDMSDDWPVTFQNEGPFKRHYMALVARVNKALSEQSSLLERVRLLCSTGDQSSVKDLRKEVQAVQYS